MQNYIEYNLGDNYAFSCIRDKNKKLMYVTKEREKEKVNYKLIFIMIFLESYMYFVRDLYILYKALFFGVHSKIKRTVL